MKSRARKFAAERQRRHRQRQRDGLIIAPVPLTYDEIAMLESAGVLRVADEDDRRRIGEAVAKLLATLAQGSNA